MVYGITDKSEKDAFCFECNQYYQNAKATVETINNYKVQIENLINNPFYRAKVTNHFELVNEMVKIFSQFLYNEFNEFLVLGLKVSLFIEMCKNEGLIIANQNYSMYSIL